MTTTELNFEHRGRAYTMPADWAEAAAGVGLSAGEAVALIKSGIDENAIANGSKAARTTKEVMIDRHLHDRLKAYAEKKGIKTFYALAMAVEEFLSRHQDDPDGASC